MELFELLDELRILAENGRRYADDPYDEERYERVLELVGEWYGHTVDRPPEAVRERFAEELGHVTPKLGADAALFDDEERVLLQLRADDGTWGLPGGYVGPNESPAETAVRETGEETGLSVDVRQLVGVYTRKPGQYGPHCLVVHLYLCAERGGTLETSHEGTELRYWHPEDVPEWHKDHRRLARSAQEAVREAEPSS